MNRTELPKSGHQMTLSPSLSLSLSMYFISEKRKETSLIVNFLNILHTLGAHLVILLIHFVLIKIKLEYLCMKFFACYVVKSMYVLRTNGYFFITFT